MITAWEQASRKASFKAAPAAPVFKTQNFRTQGNEREQRNPSLLSLRSGELLPRLAERILKRMIPLPPRLTRKSPDDGPKGLLLGEVA
jgi:hypothetical protein